MKSTAKTMVMFVISVIAGLLASSGVPQTRTASTVFFFTVLGATLTYIAKNTTFPSMSILGVIDIKDFLSAFFLGVGTALSNWIGTIVAGVPLDWKSLLTAVFSVVLGYIIKNFAAGPHPTGPPA